MDQIRNVLHVRIPVTPALNPHSSHLDHLEITIKQQQLKLHYSIVSEPKYSYI